MAAERERGADGNRPDLYTVTLDLNSTPPQIVEKMKEKGVKVN
jgi:hypothetical protein